MVQEAPTASVPSALQFGAPAGNVPVVIRENGCGVAPKVKVPPARAPVPVLVTVRGSGLLVVPVAQLPNASGFGVSVVVSVAAAAPVSSTAPASTELFALRLTTPKKSLLGAC